MKVVVVGRCRSLIHPVLSLLLSPPTHTTTQEWTDGLCSVIVRQQVKEDTPDRLYIMFDGPIDTLWIESLNTVLDDNRMLCLANGERIRLKNLGSGPSEMRMLFEVNDLAQASPATVSRLGVVYYNPEDVGWRLFVQSWLPRVFKAHLMKEELREHLWKRFDETLDKGLAWQKRYSKVGVGRVFLLDDDVGCIPFLTKLPDLYRVLIDVCCSFS